ncbi:MAG: SurA N-terminal domain-containing protein, partial [Bacteroidales bacterium]|nr:SurA N-terminal domain-containing protein [Bacteroidales bacterium]
KLVEEMSEVIKLTNGLTALSEEQLTQIKDQVWQTYVNNELIAAEAKKLGLTVTDAEIQHIIDEGTHPILMQTPFRNPQTGAFDKDMLKKFLVDYANLGTSNLPAQYVEYYQKMGNFWKFIEKTLKQNTLAQKYQDLITKSFLSNPVAAEDAFNARVQENQILLAGIPYSTISDSTITVSDADIKRLYEERKENFKQPVETRDIKYIDFRVTPSEADRKEVQDEVTDYSNQLASTTSDFGAFVRSTGSTAIYSDIPVNKTVLPADVAARLDSTAVGEVYGPYYNQTDDSYNAFKIIAKTTAPDSIEFRQIQVYTDTESKTTTLADSIFTAIKGGASFAEVAKIYGQEGTANWVNAQSWEGGTLDADNAKLVNALISQPVNELTNLKIGQANIILQVTGKKVMKDKYKVAIVKRPVEFSKETYNKAYNAFSQFVAANTTLADMEKNAEESGYSIIPRQGFSSAEHYVGGVKSTREALKWVFDAKPGQVSPLYECGDNDHLLVVALERVNKKGYVNIQQVADMLRAEIRRDKKAEQIMAQMKGFNSLSQVTAVKDAVSDTIKHVTFAAPAYISVARASEPAVSAVAAKIEQGKVSAPIKGNAGVYMIQVLAKEKTAEEFDAKKEESTLSNMAMRFASQSLYELREKAQVIDERYLYF